jgi:hypothetical protein
MYKNTGCILPFYITQVLHGANEKGSAFLQTPKYGG